MTRIFTFLLIILVTSISNAQTQKMNFSLALKLNSTASSSDLLSVFVKGNISIIKEITQQHGGNFKYAAGDIAAIQIPTKGIYALTQNSAVVKIEHSNLFTKLEALNDTMRLRNDIEPIHQGLGSLPQAYDGSGIVIGIIDSGMDINHPDYRDSIGGVSKTRIKYIWEQDVATVNPPAPFTYGTEWTASQIDSGLCTHTDTQFSGHGTHVSGIAVGNGKSVGFNQGAAPKADIILVALNFNTSSDQDVADATAYIYNKAQQLGKPCVINASLGSIIGSHDGKNLEAQAIKNLIDQQNGRVFVAAGGNSGGSPLHLGYTVNSDTSFTWFLKPSNSSQIYIQMWSDSTDFANVHFSIGADRVSPNFQFKGNIPFKNIVASPFQTIMLDTLYSNSQRIGTVLSYIDTLTGGDTYGVEFLITPDSTSFAWRLMTTGTGKFDTWSYNMVSSGLPNGNVFPPITYYQLPDIQQTIMTSFQCLDNVITVANHVNKKSHKDINGTQALDPGLTPGAIASNSSVGPTRDGRIKPDISATGAYTNSCMVLSLAAGIISAAPSYVSWGGYHLRGGGTSAAAPVVAGAAALYLQRFPTASATAVKQAFLTTAKQDAFTGSSLPNNTWGYGKLSALPAIQANLLGLPERGLKSTNDLLIYPNPSTENVTFEYDLDRINTSSNYTIKVINQLGEVVFSKTVQQFSGKYILEKAKIGTGMYIGCIERDGKIISTQKFILD
ncbi:MAG: S8 family peptidase [Bacteroidetes bacterium]|nr:S8 family peptidase [Bacteroidota bacterium]